VDLPNSGHFVLFSCFLGFFVWIFCIYMVLHWYIFKQNIDSELSLKIILYTEHTSNILSGPHIFLLL
jgi:hypothetical protein